jgi:hypothetical protein
LLEDPNMEDDDEPCFDDILSKLFWVKTDSSLLIDSSLTLSRRDSLSFWFLIFRVSSQLNSICAMKTFFIFFWWKLLCSCQVVTALKILIPLGKSEKLKSL